MDNRGIVLIYTFSPFPFGEATSNRIIALAQCIQMAGYKVIVLGNGGSGSRTTSQPGNHLYMQI